MGNETQRQKNAQRQDSYSEMFENLTNSAIKKAGSLSSGKDAEKISKNLKKALPENKQQ